MKIKQTKQETRKERKIETKKERNNQRIRN